MEAIQSYRKWTEEETKLLVDLYCVEGLSPAEIANKMSRTKQSVVIKRKRMQLRHTKEQKFSVRSRVNKGNLNGMFGKISPRRGKTKYNCEYVRLAGQKVSEAIRTKLSNGESWGFGVNGRVNPSFIEPVWNKGLTKETDERVKKSAEKGAKTHSANWKNLDDEAKARKMQQLLEGMRCKKETFIESRMKSFLLDNGIDFIPQYVFNTFLLDFYLPDYNVAVECLGDYWHGNYKFYNRKSLDIIQKENIKRDIIKKRLLKKEKVYYFFIWEDDIRNKFEQTSELILGRLNEVRSVRTI
jgi:G:T-mismatch repair DNA endonuclease (very short patch repair protein)